MNVTVACGRFYCSVALIVTFLAQPTFSQGTPLTFEKISEYLRKGIGIAALQEVVKKDGVAFDLTDEQARQLRLVGPPGRYSPNNLDALIGTLKAKGETNKPAAKTPDLERSAPTIPPSPPPSAAPASAIVVTCDARSAECLIRMDKGSPQRTTHNQYRFANVTAGTHTVELSADGFLSESVPVNLKAGEVGNLRSVSLKPDPNWDPQVVFQKILNAVGGDADINLVGAIQAEANSVIGNQLSLRIIESIVAPNWARWDITVPTGQKMAIVIPLGKSLLQTTVDGDAQIKNSPVASDLKRSLEALQRLRVNQVLPALKDAKYDKTFPQIGNRVLMLTGPDGVFEIGFDDKFRPTRILHRPRQPRGGARVPVSDITYGNYAAVGSWTLPFSVIVRFPETPDFVQGIRYAAYYLGADLSEKDANRKYNADKQGIDISRKDPKKHPADPTKCFSELGFEQGPCRQK